MTLVDDDRYASATEHLDRKYDGSARQIVMTAHGAASSIPPPQALTYPRCSRLEQNRVMLVSNGVRSGIAPENELARRLRDRPGRLHQSIAAVADEVCLVMAGLTVRMKSRIPDRRWTGWWSVMAVRSAWTFAAKQ